MSSTLGPIHYWLYQKIQFQENLISDIKQAFWTNPGQMSDRSILKNATKCGVGVPLEHIIDMDNIHGWLQDKITDSEIRLATLVTQLIRFDANNLTKLEEVAFNFGKKHAIAKGTKPKDAYSILEDSLLDGMPCDRVNEVLENAEDYIAWHQTKSIHDFYWKSVGGDIDYYYALRALIIDGMLEQSDLLFYDEPGYEYSIRRKNA